MPDYAKDDAGEFDFEPVSKEELEALYREWREDYAAARQRDQSPKPKVGPPCPSEIVRQARQERQEQAGERKAELDLERDL